MIRVTVFAALVFIVSNASGQFIRPALPPALPDAAPLVPLPSSTEHSHAENVQIEELSQQNPLRAIHRARGAPTVPPANSGTRASHQSSGQSSENVQIASHQAIRSRPSRAMQAVANVPVEVPEKRPTVNKPASSDWPVESLALPQNAPPTVQRFHQPKRWKMKLGEALFIALNNNKQLRIQQIQPEIFKTLITEEFARFDPRIAANQHWTQSTSRISSTLDTFGTGASAQQSHSYGSRAGYPEQFSISKGLTTGGNVRLSYNAGSTQTFPAGLFTTLNPEWSTSLNLSFTQPLARGSGRQLNLMPLKISRINQQGSEIDFERAVQRLMHDVEQAYWGLVFSHQNLEVRRNEVEETRKTYEKELEKLALGQSARPQVGEAKLGYFRNVDLYRRRQAELLSAERQFRTLLGLPGFDDRRIFVDLPEESADVEADWEWSLAVMLERRADLQTQRLSEKNARLRYAMATDSRRPDITFQSNISKSGLSDNYNQAFERMVNENDHTWSMGLTYGRDVHRYRAQAEIRRSRLRWMEQARITENMEYAATNELQAAYQALFQKRDQLSQLKNVYDAAMERQAAYTEQFELGAISIELYLRSRAATSDAELQLRLAKVELRQAIVAFEFSRGTLLESRGMVVEDQQAEIDPLEDRDNELLKVPESKQSPRQNRAPEFDELMKEAAPSIRDRLQEPAKVDRNSRSVPPSFRDLMKEAAPSIRELLEKP